MARGTNFRGELRFSGMVRLDGIFDGKIFSDGVLVVGETGVVKGEIRVGELLVNGIVEGLIEARTTIDVVGRGRLLGQVFTPSLNVAEGVIVEAQLRVGSPDPDVSTTAHSSVAKSIPKDPVK